MNHQFLHPLKTYIVLWVITSTLIWFSFTDNLIAFDGYGALLVFLTILSAILFTFLETAIKKTKNNRTIVSYDLTILTAFGDKLYILWLTLVVLYGYLTDGYNLIWIIKGVKVDYVDSQINSLWGMIVTFCYILACIYFYIIITAKKVIIITKVKFGVILFFPILIFSRNVMIQMALQLFVVWMFCARINIKNLFIKLAIVFIAAIYLFGLIGDTRTVGGVENPFQNYVKKDYYDLFSFLPSGFTWLYIYITANYNNAMNGLNIWQPTYEFYPVFMNLIPGAIKPLLFDSNLTTNEVMSQIVVDPSLTVASFFGGPIIGFGFWGAFTSGIIVQLIALHFYNKSLANNFGNMLCYSVIYACIMFSIFYDCFFTFGTLTQIIFGIYLSKRLNNSVVKTLN